MEPLTPNGPEPAPGTPVAGWYADPSDPGLIRYWDGGTWTEQVAPRQPEAPRPPEVQQPSWAPIQPMGTTPMGASPMGATPMGTSPMGMSPAAPVVRPAPPGYPMTYPARPGYPGARPPGPPLARRGIVVVGVVVVSLFVLCGIIGAIVLGVRSGTEAVHRPRVGSSGQDSSGQDSPGQASPGQDSPDQRDAGDCGNAAPRTVAPPAALLAAPAKGKPVITPSGAEDLVKTFWPLREQALHHCGLDLLRATETGSALAGDLHRGWCGCLVRPEGAPLDESRMFVPRRTSYPAWFGAQVRTVESGGDSYLELMVFTRASTTTPWRLDLSTGWTAVAGELVTLSDPEVDAGGYLVTPDAATRGAVRPAARRLAALWQGAKDTGRVPGSSFTPSYWTDELPGKLAEHRQDTLQGNGLVGHFTYRARPSAPVYHLAMHGADLGCTVVQVRSVYTRNKGRYPFQTRDRRNWGAELAPGEYKSITLTGQSQTCFLVPTGGQQPILVLGGDQSTEAIATGVPKK